MFSYINSFVPEQPLAKTTTNTSLPGEIDLTFLGIKETPKGFLFQAGVRGINNSALCNNFSLPNNGPLGSGTNTTKYYFYLDTDGNNGNGCGAPIVGGVNHSTKFDFIVQYTASHAGKVTEAKTLFKCTNDIWGPTNVFVSSRPTDSCRINHSNTNTSGEIALMVEKESFEKFSEFKKTQGMRVLVTAGDSNSTRNAPNKTLGPGTYSPGSFGFIPVDCSSPSASSDPKCSKLKTFGYIAGEDCFTASDDDADGLINCNDIDCKNEALCAGEGVNSGGSQYYWANDKVAPQILFTTTDVYPDGAYIKYDTNEPANGSIDYYDTDNNCTVLNKTIRDVGIIDAFMPDYKSWHEGALDNFASNPEAIGAPLVNGTPHYYKIRVCDEAENCAVSQCLNFTTAKSSAKKDCPSCNAVFKFTPPSGMSVKFDFGAGYIQQNGTACGLKVNYTQTKKAKIKLQNGNLSLELINVSIGGKISDNVNSFNTTEMPSDSALSVGGITTGCIGLTKEKFAKMKAAGMSPEKIKIQIPKGTAGCTILSQCDACTAGASCKDLTNASGVQMINETADFCEWLLPASYDYI